jgi:light-regulated signal transduction histidine kinase (bacteriophytochrome)
MLAIPISMNPGYYVLLFRREQNVGITWGGDPNKAVTSNADGDRISPRKSFAAFTEMVRGRAKPFSERDLRAGEAVRLSMTDSILRRVQDSQTQRSEEAQRQEVLIAELNHRVRNILSLIRGLILQTRPGLYLRPIRQRDFCSLP